MKAPLFPVELIDERADGHEVTIWLHEFEIYGGGPDIEAALDDLLEEIEIYAQWWRSEATAMLKTANRSQHGLLLDLMDDLRRQGGLREALRPLGA